MIPKDKFKEITMSIMDMDIGQARKVIEIAQMRKEVLGKQVKHELKSGDKVFVYGTRVSGEATVREVKRTRAVVLINGKAWSCPLSNLEPIKEEDATN